MTNKNDTGMHQTAANAILKSKKNIDNESKIVEAIEPKNSGIKCDKACSIPVTSERIVVVKSERSRFEKNINEIGAIFQLLLFVVSHFLYKCYKMSCYIEYSEPRRSTLQQQ